MAVTLRSGRELEERRAKEKDTEEKKHAEIREELKHHSSETIEEESTTKMQQVEKGNLGKKEKVKAYNP